MMHLHVLFVSFSFMLRLIFFADCAKPYLISVFEDLNWITLFSWTAAFLKTWFFHKKQLPFVIIGWVGGDHTSLLQSMFSSGLDQIQ